MPVLFRVLKRPVVLLTAVSVGAAVLLPAASASATTRSGVVTVTIPSRIVIDGGKVPVRVDSDALYSSLDRVDFDLYLGDRLEDTDEVKPNTQTLMSTAGWNAGALVGKADLATTECSGYSDDPCHLRRSDLYYYEFINGLAYQDSTAATAKYGSEVSLAGVRKKKSVVWTATVQRYDGGEWVAFKGAVVTIGEHQVTADRHGKAVWTERTSSLHRYRASVAETTTVWSSTSRPTKAVRPVEITSTSSAAAVGIVMRGSLPSVTKVRGLRRSSDPNKLLGRSNGYSSAAVLYDSRTRCSDGPGADCGATIERWPSSAKAKARSTYILSILDQLPALGSEHHTVKGRFLLRVTGDLTAKQARAYSTAFRSTL